MTYKTMTESEYNKYRFSGIKYSLRGPTNYGPSDYIPQETGLYTFPKGEEQEIIEESTSSGD
jgi:hypothetical protein